ncbi:hypothetical protein JKP88DRAFT_346785 [Tribonema minus]|uniref:Uncharacterized protein n=1 Tax=Tribonema minus TaxID=303371 RepID=A0A835YTG9_9STRA|nr:hypothetical protein JKP88DRAFT_346785 [Tribonema minus]
MTGRLGELFDVADALRVKMDLVIHLVRDPRAVLASRYSVGWLHPVMHTVGWLHPVLHTYEDTFKWAQSLCTGMMDDALAVASRPEYMLLRYEDLAALASHLEYMPLRYEDLAGGAEARARIVYQRIGSPLLEAARARIVYQRNGGAVARARGVYQRIGSPVPEAVLRAARARARVVYQRIGSPVPEAVLRAARVYDGCGSGSEWERQLCVQDRERMAKEDDGCAQRALLLSQLCVERMAKEDDGSEGAAQTEECVQLRERLTLRHSAEVKDKLEDKLICLDVGYNTRPRDFAEAKDKWKKSLAEEEVRAVEDAADDALSPRAAAAAAAALLAAAAAVAALAAAAEVAAAAQLQLQPAAAAVAAAALLQLQPAAAAVATAALLAAAAAAAAAAPAAAAAMTLAAAAVAMAAARSCAAALPCKRPQLLDIVTAGAGVAAATAAATGTRHYTQSWGTGAAARPIDRTSMCTGVAAAAALAAAAASVTVAAAVLTLKLAACAGEGMPQCVFSTKGRGHRRDIPEHWLVLQLAHAAKQSKTMLGGATSCAERASSAQSNAFTLAEEAVSCHSVAPGYAPHAAGPLSNATGAAPSTAAGGGSAALKHVIISGEGRSGSTLVGTLFKAPEWAYFYE